MKKRGVSHVDWVISMGIFILYVVALFIFLRPGVTVEHKPQALLDLMEEEVKNEIVINVKETPLHVKCCKQYMKDGSSIPSTISVQDKKNNWRIIKVLEGGFDVTGDVTSGSDFELVCDGEDITTARDYILSFVPKNKEETSISLELKCNGNECPADEKSDAELRATENRYVVYKNWLESDGWVEDINKDGNIYEELKYEFGFPQEKEFAIYFLIDTEELKEEYLEVGPKDMKKPEQGNVYILEWKDSYIDSSRNYGEVIVHIEIW